MTLPTITVTVVYSSAARQTTEVILNLPATATVADALAASKAPSTPEFEDIGIWGRKAPADQVLRDGDRVEMYRPLAVDPKIARRERFKKQGKKSAGLFATLRPGAKSGY